MRLSEQALVLGERKSLVGILTQVAASESSPASDLAVVILNTGIIHRVGHHRMYVTFSRMLADAGYTVLRFDLSGIGDSDRRTDGISLLESGLADIKETIDWLEATKQIKRVVLIGLCSGADYSVHFSARDPRVVGLVLMEPSIPPTTKHLRKYLAKRLLNLRSWLNVFSGSSQMRKILFERIASAVNPHWQPQNTTLTHPKIRSELEQVYEASVKRGVKFLAIFAVNYRQTYSEQLRDAFPNISFEGNLQSKLFEDADHMFTSGAIRAKLMNMIIEWLRKEGLQ